MQTFVQFTISLFTLTNESYRHLIQPFFLIILLRKHKATANADSTWSKKGQIENDVGLVNGSLK